MNAINSLASHTTSIFFYFLNETFIIMSIISFLIVFRIVDKISIKGEIDGYSY